LFSLFAAWFLGGAAIFQIGSDGRLTLSGWLLNQLDSPDFAWRTKNFFLDELNVLKRKLFVKSKKTIDDYRFKSSMLWQNVRLRTSGRSPRRRHCPRNKDSAPLHPALHPKLKASNRLHLPVVRAVEIRFRRPDVRMAHQRLNRPQIITIIQEGCSERMPHDVRMNPLLDQRLLRH